MHHNVHCPSQFDKRDIEKERYFINHENLIGQPMITTWNMARSMPFKLACVTVLLCVLQVFWSFLGQWRCQRMTCRDVWWILGICIPLYICTILSKEQPSVTMATAASSEWASFPLSSVNMMIVVCMCSPYCSYCAARRLLYRCLRKKM